MNVPEKVIMYYVQPKYNIAFCIQEIYSDGYPTGFFLGRRPAVGPVFSIFTLVKMTVILMEILRYLSPDIEGNVSTNLDKVPETFTFMPFGRRLYR